MEIKTVLIVDDEDILRKAISYHFKRAGYNTITASCGNEALEILTKHKVDAVISDIQMPDGNGIELLSKIRDKDHELPVVIFISAYADITDDEAYDMGANAIFSKPFNREKLTETVKLAIETKGKVWKNNLDVNPSIPVSFNLEDISPGRGGMFVALQDDQLFEIDQEFSFVIEGHNEIAGTGRVKWIRKNKSLPDGIGIEITGFTNESHHHYEKMLEVLPLRPYIPKTKAA